MNDAAPGLLASILDYAGLALHAIDSTGMAIALVATGAILAAGGGLLSSRMRFYGAIVGGMLVNIVVKAGGGSYVAAFAAMAIATALAFTFGSALLLVRLLVPRRH